MLRNKPGSMVPSLIRSKALSGRHGSVFVILGRITRGALKMGSGPSHSESEANPLMCNQSNFDEFSEWALNKRAK
jgi:hypothetical protein